MNDIEYVKNLDLARDENLSRLRRGFAGDEPLKGGEKALPPGSAITVGLQTAVNGGSIMSFVAGLSPEEKSDVLFSTQFAQRGATVKHNRYEALNEWYAAYVAVLERLGWVIQGDAKTWDGSDRGTLEVDQEALDLIAAFIGPLKLGMLTTALDIIKQSAKTDRASVRVFNTQAMAELSGNFQLGSVERSDDGALSLALGAYRFRVKENQESILGFRWTTEQIEFWAEAQTMTLNGEHYARVRDIVRTKLGDEALDYIVDMDIA